MNRELKGLGWTNFFASLVGALMYFATLTEVPIVRGLMDSGMDQGPALALPTMLVINAIISPRKTTVFVALVVSLSTLVSVRFGFSVHEQEVKDEALV